MNNEGQTEISESKYKATESRRRFIKRTTAGALLASLPATSAWGNGNLIAGSIVASGHGSDFSTGNQIQLLSPGYWKNHTSNWNALLPSATFNSVFAIEPFGTLKQNNVPLTLNEKQNVTLLEVLQNTGSGQNGFGGPSNVNVFMVQILLNAAHHGQSMSGQLINFPVIKGSVSYGQINRGLFNSINEFAIYLRDKAQINASGLAMELSTLLNNNHA